MADAGFGPFSGHAAGEHLDATLGNLVGRHRGACEFTRQRSYIDNLPKPTWDHTPKTVDTEGSKLVMTSSQLGFADDWIGAPVDGWKQIDTETGLFHREDVAVFDGGHCGGRFVPASIEGASRLLNQRTGLAEGYVDGCHETNRTGAVMWGLRDGRSHEGTLYSGLYPPTDPRSLEDFKAWRVSSRR